MKETYKGKKIFVVNKLLELNGVSGNNFVYGKKH